MASGRRWTRDELLLALHLYERIPFGQQDRRNPQVIQLARILSRTPGSVAMKLNNFTSLDPEEQRRGVKGLTGASELDRRIWTEFHEAMGALERSEELWEARVEHDMPIVPPPVERLFGYVGVTEATAERAVRLAQRYFRRVVLANFDGRCALTGITNTDLLTASHISPWADDPAHRADARNGVCLNKLHDAAFDKKLITFDDDFRLIVGKRLREQLSVGELARAFLVYEGKPLAVPHRRPLSTALMARHRSAFMDAERRA